MKIKNLDFLVNYNTQVHILVDYTNQLKDTTEYKGIYGQIPPYIRTADIETIYPNDKAIGIRASKP